MLSRSACLSADVNAAFDPTFASAYEANNASFLNNGVVVTKYTGSGGKGGTSDASAEFMGRIRSLLDKKVLWQVGELGKVDGGGGGTVAKYIANMNVDVVDVAYPCFPCTRPLRWFPKSTYTWPIARSMNFLRTNQGCFLIKNQSRGGCWSRS